MQPPQGPPPAGYSQPPQYGAPPPAAIPMPPPPAAQPAPQPYGAPPTTGPAVPVPAPQPSPGPSVVSQLDAIPKDAEKKAGLAFIWFMICSLIFIAIGAYLLFLFNDAVVNSKPGNLTALVSFGGVMITFGILSIILGMIVKIKIIGGMHTDKWDTAVDMSLLIGIPGFLFGLGLSGWWLYNINKKMRDHPFYLKTLPPPTPVCERCRQPVTFNVQQQKWYCPNCKIYL